MTNTATRARYTYEFKQEAVRLVEGGQSQASVARTLGGMAHEALVPILKDYLRSQGFDESTPEKKQEFDALMNAASGATAAWTADVYNRQLHDFRKVSEKAFLEKASEGKSAEEEHRLYAAACALVQCYAEYPEGSAEYQAAWALSEAGKTFTGLLGHPLGTFVAWHRLNDEIGVRFMGKHHRSLDAFIAWKDQAKVISRSTLNYIVQHFYWERN
jgi:transposase-like protein